MKTPTNKHVGNIPLNNKNSHGLQNNIVNILPINIYTRIATRWEIYRNLDNQGNKSLLPILHGEILVEEKYWLVYSLKASWWLYTDCKLLKANVEFRDQAFERHLALIQVGLKEVKLGLNKTFVTVLIKVNTSQAFISEWVKPKCHNYCSNPGIGKNLFLNKTTKRKTKWLSSTPVSCTFCSL